MAKKIMNLNRILMMIVTVSTLVVAGFSTVSHASEAPIVKLNDLIENGKQYDGQVVKVKGEALLEALERKDGTWININDGSNAMGLWMDAENAKKIKQFGDYHQNGEQVTVLAKFNRSCQLHGGDMDLHLVTLLEITSGSQRQHPIASNRYIWLGLFSLLGICLVALYNKDKFK